MHKDFIDRHRRKTTLEMCMHWNGAACAYPECVERNGAYVSAPMKDLDAVILTSPCEAQCRAVEDEMARRDIAQGGD